MQLVGTISGDADAAGPDQQPDLQQEFDDLRRRYTHRVCEYRRRSRSGCPTEPAPSPSPIPSPPAAIDCGSNPSASRNEEIFYVTLAASGAPTACRQITTTTPTNPGDPINILDIGSRMSRDGRFVAFDSFADLAGENSPVGTNYTSFASYVFDANAPPATAFRRFLPRSDADTAASGGDIPRYPGFTDYDVAGQPLMLLLRRV